MKFCSFCGQLRNSNILKCFVVRDCNFRPTSLSPIDQYIVEKLPLKSEFYKLQNKPFKGKSNFNNIENNGKTKKD